MKRHLIIMVTLLLAITSCSTDRDPSDLLAPEGVGVIVVDALLVAGEPNPVVRVSQTLAPGVAYTEENAALRGATVSISDGAQTHDYNESTFPGLYGSVSNWTPTSGRTYHLTVRAADGRVVTATTTVPGAVALNRWVLLSEDAQTVVKSWAASDTTCPELVYTVGLLEAQVTQGTQIGYQVGLESLSAGSALLIDPEDFDAEPADFRRRISSPPFDALDGFIRLPWFAIYFEGDYLLNVYAMDRNWYDLVRSTPGLQGGPGFGGQAGDSFNKPIFRINGGIGLFGSATLSSKCFTIVPK